ncbi:TRAF-type domain-containing protein [Hirschfeldia incana]|nr:TRAF-type domain-containing protein [Hirschfeldia incana]
MDPPVSDPDKIDDQKEKAPSFHCDLYDTELVHKISQTLLPGLSTACVDNTTGDIFRSPGSVAADIRKEMIDYLTLRSETFVAEHIVLQGGGSDAEASHHPFDIVSDFIDDFATSKRNLFSRVSGWLLSERREDNIDDFAQEMEISGFWLSDHRQGLAQTLLKNVDFKNLSHCEMKFQTEEEVAGHALSCGYRTMDCENEGCNAVFCKKQMEVHDSVCPFKIVQCEQGCDESGIMRREMDRHCITVCPMKLVNCAFRAVGCLDDVRQCEVQQHQVDSVGSHLMCVLKSIYKEASVDDLKPRAEQIQQLSARLSEAKNARSLTNLVKDIDAKLGPLEIKPKNVTVLEKGLEEAEVKGKPETAGSVEQTVREDEVVSKEAEVLVDDVKKVSEAEIAENVNEEGELKAQKLLEIGEFIKEGDNRSAADLSERTETKAPEVVVMDEDREEDESGETKQSTTNETRGLETEANEENREAKKSDETKSEAPSRIAMDKEENEEGTETVNLNAPPSAEDREEEENAETKQSRANETRGIETEVIEENKEAKKSDETKSEAPSRIVMDKEENEQGAETINSGVTASDEAEALSKSSEAFSKAKAETEPNMS